MLTRFELFVILRNQVADRGRVRRSLAHEAGMEALARLVGADATTWGMVGLGAGIDADLTASNPARRGEVAGELLRTEGAAPGIGEAVRARVQDEPERMPVAAAAMVVVEAIVDLAWEEESLDDVDGRVIGHRLRRAGGRVAACAARAGIDLIDGATAVVEAMRSIREDLRR